MGRGGTLMEDLATGYRLQTRVLVLMPLELLLFCLFLFPVACQQVIIDGVFLGNFTSLDCGSTTTAYTDPYTTIQWSSDEDYLDSAVAIAADGIQISAKVEYNSNSTATTDSFVQLYTEQLKTARVFLPGPKARGKYCYTFAVNYHPILSYSYIVRAIFPPSTLTSNNGSAIPGFVDSSRFYLTIDSTFIYTVELLNDSYQFIEIIAGTLDENMFVCLVPLEDRSSMPAISTLEVRPLAPGMYGRGGDITKDPDTVFKTTYLTLVSRLNCGADINLPSLRYPQDQFDRIWTPMSIVAEARAANQTKAGSEAIKNFVFKDVKNTSAVSWGGLSDPFRRPLELLLTAWQGDPGFQIWIDFQDSFAFKTMRPLPTFLSAILVDDIVAHNATEKRYMNVTLDGHKWVQPDIDFSLGPQAIYAPRNVFQNNVGVYGFFRNESSDLPALLSAAELLGEFEAVMDRTDRDDADTVKNFSSRATFHLETTGDPCLPVPWDWLVCSIEVPPRITQVNLTNKAINGIFPDDLSLNRLTILDVSNTNISGQLPITLDQSFSLRRLNLAQNLLSGEIPEFQRKSLKHLESLSLSDNLFKGGLSSLIGALADPIYELNLSRNSFNGSIPEVLGDLVNLEILDLSNNKLTGPMNVAFDKLTVLTELKLENNELDGAIPASIWRNQNLKTVILVRNKFTELNLSTWDQTLATASSTSSSMLVSLLYNEIQTVVPFPDYLQRAAETNRLPTLLLAGNPWCSNHPKDDDAFHYRYLCRFSPSDSFDTNGDSNRRYIDIIIIAATCGSAVVFLACICSASLWRVWQQMRDLHEIQEVLAKDHVKPPFFKYEELRVATRDFHPDTNLGQGAFGAVYKAVLQDGTTLAVKRLFPTQQNVSEFLNEVVLITGIKHRHLIQLKGCCVREKQRILVYEYAENNNLAEALWGKKRTFTLSWYQRLKICLGIARGLAYLHEELQPTIIHRDIKPYNILLDKDLNAKIADFGLARPSAEHKTQMATQLAGTLGYFSPEYATQGQFTEKLDVYSFGVLVLEIVAGRKCIDHSLEPELVFLRNWANDLYKADALMDLLQPELRGTCPDEEVMLVIRIALWCLQEDPTKRPTMSQVVTILAGNTTDVAIDIIGELKSMHRPSFRALFQNLDTTSLSPLLGSLGHERDTLLDSHSASTATIDASIMIPR